MRFRFLYLSSLVLLFSIHCTSDNKSGGASSWISPISTTVNLGTNITLQVQTPSGAKIDSIVYWIDSKRMLSSKDSKPVVLNTDSLALGFRAITAWIYKGGEPEEITTNIEIKSALMPEKFSYQVLKVCKHDTASYTEGLEYHNGFLYESDGEYGASSLRKVDPVSCKVLQVTPIKSTIFGEGITVVGDKILMLTYREKVAMEYDLKTLKLIREFPFLYAKEGWGMCTDGKKLYYTDSSNTIHILNKDTYQEEGYLEVYDQNGPVQAVNELEYIDGKLYANVYQSNRIIIINPKNGQVTGEVDLMNLYPEEERNLHADVLNGIAWDAKGKRLFVTGKKWDKLFQIKIKAQSIAGI